MKAFQPFRTIRSKLYLLLFWVLVPVLVIKGFDHYHRYKEREFNEYQANLEVARAVSTTFDEYLRNILHHEFDIGLHLTFPHPPTPSQMNQILKDNLRHHPEVRNFAWVDPQCRIVASSMDSMIGIDFADHADLHETLTGKEWSISSLTICKITKEPVIAVSRRINDQKGVPAGVVIAAIYPDKLGKLLSKKKDHTRTISVFDREGNIIFEYPVKHREWKDRGALKANPAIRAALNGKEVTAVIPHFLGGENQMVALTPIEFNGWIVSSSRSVHQVFQPIISGSVRQAGILVILVIFVFAIAMFISQKIVSPLKKLQKQALAFGQNSTYSKLTIRGSTEIQDLAFAFNQMTEEISKREKKLDSARLRLFTLLEAIPAFVYIQAPDYSINYANRTFRETFGAPEGKHCYEILRGEKQPCSDCTVNMPLDFGIIQDWKWYSPNCRIYQVYDRPFEDFDGKLLVLKMGIDITEQEMVARSLGQSEKQLRKLSARLLSAQEEERKRIAGEIHDSIGQTLVAMKFSVDKALRDTTRNDPDEAFQAIEFLGSLIKDAIQEARTIHTGLRPPILDSEGIIATMNWFCQNFQTIYPLHQLVTEFNVSENEIAEELKIVIFRVSQEALNNIAKYSRADQVHVSISKTAASIALSIIDNGVGFNLQNRANGLGLTSMQERVEISGGQFSIKSNIGEGTCLQAKWKSIE